MNKITVVINSYNEEKTIERAVRSVSWADEILVCDMNSEDDTAVIAKKNGAKVIFHKYQRFVEPARNFAVSKASNEWVLILDPDEEAPTGLEERLRDIAQNGGIVTHVELPRRNIIFDKWVKASMWWPDYNIRFFKKNSAVWSNNIHRPPKTVGQGLKLPAEERVAIIHHHYDTIWQFLERMNRYTDIQAEELIDNNYEFDWKDLIKKPLSEFLSRYFAHRGFEDGLHGLVLGILQGFSFFVVYIKVWEAAGFKEKAIALDELKEISSKGGNELTYWFKYGNLSKNPVKAFLQRAKNKLI